MNEKAARSLGRGIACIVVAIIIGFIGAMFSTSGYSENAIGGFMLVGAAIIGIIGLGCLISGGVMAAATRGRRV